MHLSKRVKSPVRKRKGFDRKNHRIAAARGEGLSVAILIDEKTLAEFDKRGRKKRKRGHHPEGEEGA
jgi:hypothetical protein